MRISLTVLPVVLACLLCAFPPGARAQTPAVPEPGDPPSTAVTKSPDEITPTLPVKAQRPSLMIKKGGRELEWRTMYSHSSRNAVYIDGISIAPILVIGEIGVERIRKESLTTSLAGRYGVRDNMLVELKVPLRYEFDRSSVPEVSPPEEHVVHSFGIGDIEGGVFYQLPRENEDRIRWVASATVKSHTGKDPFEAEQNDEAPLGSGFWNTRFGLTGVKIVDPAAVYWNVGYTINWERKDIPITVTDLETGEETIVLIDVKPANTVEVGGGFAYAINSRLSVNTGLSISWSGSSCSNGQDVPNSAFTTATLRLGAVWLTESNLPVDIGLSIGLTDDSPDFSLEYRMSFK